MPLGSKSSVRWARPPFGSNCVGTSVCVRPPPIGSVFVGSGRSGFLLQPAKSSAALARMKREGVETSFMRRDGGGRNFYWAFRSVAARFLDGLFLLDEPDLEGVAREAGHVVQVELAHQ